MTSLDTYLHFSIEPPRTRTRTCINSDRRVQN